MSGILDIIGRVAIVTSSSSGLGRAIALALASEGASVICSDLTPEFCSGGYEQSQTPTHEGIQQNLIGKAIFQKADASSEDDMKALVQLEVKTFERLDM